MSPVSRPNPESDLARMCRDRRVALWKALFATDAAPLLRVRLRPQFGELDADPSHALSLAPHNHRWAAEALTWTLEVLDDPEVRRRCVCAGHAAQQARDALAAANLGLVTMVARRYERGHMTLSDLVQEGTTGLLRAIDRFDPDRGHRFSTYAVWWIRHAIGRALSDRSREIRLPVHVVEDLYALHKARAALEQRDGRLPSSTELAGHLGVSPRRVERLLSWQYRPARTTSGQQREQNLDVDELPDSTDAPDADRERFTLGLDRALSHLSPLENEILRCRFGLDGDAPMTLREVGERHDLSRERIRQLQARAISRIRREFTQYGLA